MKLAELISLIQLIRYAKIYNVKPYSHPKMIFVSQTSFLILVPLIIFSIPPLFSTKFIPKGFFLTTDAPIQSPSILYCIYIIILLFAFLDSFYETNHITFTHVNFVINLSNFSNFLIQYSNIFLIENFLPLSTTDQNF